MCFACDWKVMRSTWNVIVKWTALRYAYVLFHFIQLFYLKTFSRIRCHSLHKHHAWTEMCSINNIKINLGYTNLLRFDRSGEHRYLYKALTSSQIDHVTLDWHRAQTAASEARCSVRCSLIHLINVYKNCLKHDVNRTYVLLLCFLHHKPAFKCIIFKRCDG